MSSEHTRRTALSLRIAAGATFDTNCVFAKAVKKETKTPMSQKQKVVDLLKSFETGASKPMGYINATHYTQHNMAVADGLSGFKAFAASLPKDTAKVKTVRVFEDGNFVFAHTIYDFSSETVGFDIFRFEHGKIVEHWDNLQDMATPNPSGHTLVDGSTTVTDLDKTRANKTLVTAFVDDILVNGRVEKLAGYYDGDTYIQHNPHIGDGVSGLGAAFKDMAAAGITMKYDTVHKVLGEGNFVLTVSEGHLGGKHSAFYDLFRIANGKIAEHWDTIETIPPETDWNNTNGKFNF